MKSLTLAIGKLIDMVGYLCGLLMILMVLNVFYDVVMRYVFNNASIGMQELEWHLFATMFMFGIGFTLKQGGHVRVDIIYDRLSPKAQAWIDIIGTLIFAIPFTALIVYFGYGYSLDAFQMGEGSADPGGLPHRWIIRSVIPLASSFVILCFIHLLLEKVGVLLDNSDQRGVGL
ncbi:MAG: TRAP-type mannitol/chloroaromatic compound transport system permease small subunit [Arenicella sp.]|jgi:TRAP-type mannitol/chloroaromatic compound transport system permease small subunit